MPRSMDTDPPSTVRATRPLHHIGPGRRNTEVFARRRGRAVADAREAAIIETSGPVSIDRPVSSAADLRRLDPGGGMADYTATAVREGDYWVVDVDGIGTTQADTVDDIEQMAVDLVAAKT